MLKAVSLLFGSFLGAGAPTNEAVRAEIVQHVRTMIGVPIGTVSHDLTGDPMNTTPLKFCRLLLDDLQHELLVELKSCGITLEQIEQAYEFQKKVIQEEDHQRRLLPSEKPSHPRVKKVINELCARWNIPQSVRVINYQGGSCMGCARLTELFFDEEWWENEFENNEDVLRFIAGHELRHIYTEDLALDEALGDLQKKIKNKRKAQKARKAITALKKLAEVQADTESALESARSLRGYQCWTSHDIRGCGDTGSSAHPMMSQRSRLGDLLQQLNDLYQPQSRKKRRIEL